MLTSVICFLLAVFDLGALCPKWGTVEQAEALFTTRRALFVEIHEVLRREPQLTIVSPDDDIVELARFLPEYQGWSQDTLGSYYTIIQKLEALAIQRVRVARFTDRFDNDVEYVDFTVFGRGFGGSTEAIMISRVEGSDPKRDPELIFECKKLEELWYVCHYD